LRDLPAEAASIVFVVSIHEAAERRQWFGQIRSAFIRIVNNASGLELARFALNEGASEDAAIIFGAVYRSGQEWQFRALGDGDPDGLVGIIRKYGIDAT
jgi:tellurium resistance protein TerD